MGDVLLGLLALVVGAVFCFRGYLTMRLVIPVWGAFTGFALGAGVVGGITGDGFLVGSLAWTVGIALGLVFAVIAYTYYEVAIVLSMGAAGFVLGSSLMVALDVRWSWVVVLTGVATGLALALLAIVGNLPMLLLTLVTATAGAATMVGGAMLLTGGLTTDDLGSSAVVSRIDDSPGWWLLYALLAIAGAVLQLRLLDDIRRSVRAQWAADGGRELTTR
jgi:hypothetical protein